jgi:hypothetical protein
MKTVNKHLPQTGIVFRHPFQLGVALLALGLAVALSNRLVVADEPVTIDFRNRIPGVLDAPVYDFDGVTRLGAREGLFLAALYVSASSPESLMPVGQVMTFLTGTNAGYWGYEPPQPVEVTLPGVSLGQRVWCKVLVLEDLSGIEEQRVFLLGQSKVYSMVVTNSVMPLVGFESFSLSPEELRIRRQGDQVVVEWNNLLAREYYLEATSSLQPPVQWQTVFSLWNDNNYSQTIAFTNVLTSVPQFYRLQRWQ